MNLEHKRDTTFQVDEIKNAIVKLNELKKEKLKYNKINNIEARLDIIEYNIQKLLENYNSQLVIKNKKKYDDICVNLCTIL